MIEFKDIQQLPEIVSSFEEKNYLFALEHQQPLSSTLQDLFPKKKSKNPQDSSYCKGISGFASIPDAVADQNEMELGP